MLLLIWLLSACAAEQSRSAQTIQTTAEEAKVLLAGQEAATPVLDTMGTMNALSAEVTLTFPTEAPPYERNTELEYSIEDRPDEKSGYLVHFVYAIPLDGVDRLRDVSGEVEFSAATANYWVEQQTGGRSLRYDTFEGKLDISFLVLPYLAEDISYLAFNEYLRRAGFEDGDKAYVVYYDGLLELTGNQALCGLQFDNTAVIFLQAYFAEYKTITCPRPTRTENYAGHLELTLVHEIFHILGAVPKCAPHSDGAGHVSDSSYDIMSPSFSTAISPELTVLDWHRDDYYGHDSDTCPNLANSVFIDPVRQNADTPPGWR